MSIAAAGLNYFTHDKLLSIDVSLELVLTLFSGFVVAYGQPVIYYYCSFLNESCAGVTSHLQFFPVTFKDGAPL
jgi:hypothetical protein